MEINKLAPGQIYKNDDVVVIPMNHLPIFRSTIAIQSKVAHKLLFKSWGGIGDQICAEPTIRYALEHFKDCEIYLASDIPEIFSHLKFKKVFNLKEEVPIGKNYFVFETITPPDETNLVWQFFSHLLTNCVDFPSLCALRMQLPIKDREVKLPSIPDWIPPIPLPEKIIAIHPGKHWESKTFPSEWWSEVIYELVIREVTPVIIGADVDDNKSTVKISTGGCIDVRNKLSILETITLLNFYTDVLLTNDSAPLHMAAPGTAWIGFIATCKHPDMITHYRHGEWGWRMQNHGKGGMWELSDYCPNKEEKVEVQSVDPNLLLSWLPNPKEYAEWAVEKTHGNN